MPSQLSPWGHLLMVSHRAVFCISGQSHTCNANMGLVSMPLYFVGAIPYQSFTPLTVSPSLPPSCPSPLAYRLIQQGKLTRMGAGGRGDPFSYKATPAGLNALEDIIINALG